jgi:hypothetical protein
MGKQRTVVTLMRIEDAAIRVTDTGSEYFAVLTAHGEHWTGAPAKTVAHAIQAAIAAVEDERNPKKGRQLDRYKIACSIVGRVL